MSGSDLRYPEMGYSFFPHRLYHLYPKARPQSEKGSNHPRNCGRLVWAVPVEENPLFSNFPPRSCSSAHFENNPAREIPGRGAGYQAVLTVDDRTTRLINRARIAARYPRHPHSHRPVPREERGDVTPFVCPCQ